MKHALPITWKTEWFSWLMILASIGLSFYFYRHFPALVATHWNFAGQADAWSSAAFAAFFFPGLILAVYVLFLVLPNLDPFKDRYKEFSQAYHNFKNGLVAFLTLIYALTGLANLGQPVRIDYYVPFLVGLLFIFIGVQIRRVKRNWFLGIRTPWSLSSDKVWDETHQTGSTLFTIAGVLIAVSGWLPESWRLLSFILVIAVLVVATLVYSYYYYYREQKSK